MILEKYEGAVFVRRRDFRACKRMLGSDDSYSYRFTDVEPLLQHIKRTHA